jgi:hypothetical protein
MCVLFCRFFGLLMLAYKSTKALKARVDLIVAVVGTEYELELRDEQKSGGSSPPKSTGDVEQELQAVELRAEQLLQFWILFGLIQFFAAYGFVYAVQLRAALVLFAAVPHIFGAAWIAFVFDRVAPPVFGVKIPATIRWIRRKLRQIGGAGSPLIRWIANVVLPADLISAANTQGTFFRFFNKVKPAVHCITVINADLLALEADLEDALKLLSAERKRRRRMQARLSTSPVSCAACSSYCLDACHYVPLYVCRKLTIP